MVLLNVKGEKIFLSVECFTSFVPRSFFALKIIILYPLLRSENVGIAGWHVSYMNFIPLPMLHNYIYASAKMPLELNF